MINYLQDSQLPSERQLLLEVPGFILEYYFCYSHVVEDFDTLKPVAFPCGLTLALVPILNGGCHALVISRVVVRYRFHAYLQVRFFQLRRERIRTVQS